MTELEWWYMTELDRAKLDDVVATAAAHVGIKGHKIAAFLGTLKMCGYELRGPKGSAPSVAHDGAEAVTAQADPHQLQPTDIRMPVK